MGEKKISFNKHRKFLSCIIIKVLQNLPEKAVGLLFLWKSNNGAVWECNHSIVPNLMSCDSLSNSSCPGMFVDESEIFWRTSKIFWNREDLSLQPCQFLIMKNKCTNLFQNLKFEEQASKILSRFLVKSN